MSSIIKVDSIQNQSGGNIINKVSTSMTIGASGDTILIPSGSTLSVQGTYNQSGASNFTGAFTITTTDNSDTLTLISTDADANSGPVLVLNRDSGSPADNDIIGRVVFKGDDDAGNATNFFTVDTRIADASNGSEDFKTVFSGIVGGTERHVFTLGSTEAVFNDGSQDIDFRVESDGNANMLFVDGGNDKVGIGNSSPTGVLDIKSSTTPQLKVATASATADRNAGFLVAAVNSATGGSRSVKLSLDADGGDGSGTDNLTITKTGGDGDATIKNENSANLIFGTNNTERSRLDANGNLLVGKTSTSRPVAGIELRSTGFGRFTVDQSNPLELTRTTNDGEVIKLFKDNTHQGTVGFAGSNPFFSNSTSRGISLGSNVVACNNAGSQVDNLSDLGTSSARFKDLHLGGSITVGDSHTIGDDPNDNLEIKSSSSENIIYNSTNGLHLFEKNSTEVMRIDTNGNVGIGSSGPSAKLQVTSASSGVTPNGSGDELFVEGSANSGISIGSGNTSIGSLFFADNSDNNTGSVQYLHNSDDMRFMVNGNVERMRIFSGGNISIGTTQDQAKLQITKSSSGVTVNSFADDLFVESSSHTGITIGSGSSHHSSIYFANSSDNDIARIAVDHSDSSMRFNNNASERMRIDSSGRLLFAKTSSDNSVQGVKLTGGQIVATVANDDIMILNRTGSDGKILRFFKDTSEFGAITARSGDMSIHSTTANHAGLRFGFDSIFATSSSGAENDNVCDFGSPNLKFKDIYLGGGAFLGGTGSSNKLDDYEEGNWTPGVTFGGGNTGVSSGASTGSYTKVGRMVYVSALLLLSNKGSSTGDAKITGLPFAMGAGNKMNGAVSFAVIERISFNEVLTGTVATSSTTISLLETVSGNNTAQNITNSDFNNSTALRFNVTYQTD